MKKLFFLTLTVVFLAAGCAGGGSTKSAEETDLLKDEVNFMDSISKEMETVRADIEATAEELDQLLDEL